MSPQITISQQNYERLAALAKTLPQAFPEPDDALDYLWSNCRSSPIGEVPKPIKRGGHLRDEDVFEPLLAVLRAVGNSGMRPGDALTDLEPCLANKLTDWDRQREPSGMVRWHKRVYSAKETLKLRGYIVGYGHTRWVITPKGVNALVSKNFGP